MDLFGYYTCGHRPGTASTGEMAALAASSTSIVTTRATAASGSIKTASIGTIAIETNGEERQVPKHQHKGRRPLRNGSERLCYYADKSIQGSRAAFCCGQGGGACAGLGFDLPWMRSRHVELLLTSSSVRGTSSSRSAGAGPSLTGVRVLLSTPASCSFSRVWLAAWRARGATVGAKSPRWLSSSPMGSQADALPGHTLISRTLSAQASPGARQFLGAGVTQKSCRQLAETFLTLLCL